MVKHLKRESRGENARGHPYVPRTTPVGGGAVPVVNWSANAAIRGKIERLS
jgi:hypothetical protein